MGLDPVIVSTLLGALIGGAASIAGGVWVTSQESKTRKNERRRILGELLLAARKELEIDKAHVSDAGAEGVWYPLQHTVLTNLLASPEGLASDPLVQAEATISAYNALAAVVYDHAGDERTAMLEAKLRQVAGAAPADLDAAIATIDLLRNDRGLMAEAVPGIAARFRMRLRG